MARSAGGLGRVGSALVVLTVAAMLLVATPATRAAAQPASGWWYVDGSQWRQVPAEFVASPGEAFAYVPYLPAASVSLSVDGRPFRTVPAPPITLTEEERRLLAEPGPHRLQTTERRGGINITVTSTITTGDAAAHRTPASADTQATGAAGGRVGSHQPASSSSEPATHTGGAATAHDPSQTAPSSRRSHGGDPSGSRCATHTDPRTGNTISHCGANSDPYVPDLANASEDDIRLALAYQAGTLRFCRSDTSGYNRRTNGFHLKNPSVAEPTLLTPESAARPRAAVVNAAVEIVGAFYNGVPLPPLGSIPRPHQHHGRPKIMLHIWCSTELAEAFQTRHLAQPRLDGPITIGGRPVAEVLGTAPGSPSAPAPPNSTTMHQPHAASP